MDLSVIIPAFNEEALLAVTLKSIADAIEQASDGSCRWEAIVCDNNSDDRTADVAADHGARVILEPIQQISRARNTGARIAVGEWLLFIDADTHPPAELMAEVFDLMAKGSCIGCGTTVTVRDGTLLNKLRMERLNPIFRLFGFCGGAFLLCRADAFRAVGGFSPALYACEEIDFVCRLKRHARRKRKRFRVLHRHPVVTSGRKGDYRAGNLATLGISNVAAILLLALHAIVPRHWMPRSQSWLLRYWYGRRRRG